MTEGLKENYNKTLLVFNYGKEEDANLINSYADVAIEKASLNIDQHSMYFEHEEKVKWIDDSYMLIGKSYFYKHEFRKAKRTFNFIITKYGKNNIRYEATLWLAKTYIQMEKYGQAKSTLAQLAIDIKEEKKLPKHLKRDIHLNLADMYLHQERWDLSIEELNESLKFKMKKDLKARVQFILAQLYQQRLDYSIASELYNQVIKKNPPYEMAIRSAINRAQCYDVETKGIKPVEKQLLQLLREEKNKDYRDQIYYALADLYFRIKRDSTGIDYLRLSVASSTNNHFQKANSSLKLGDLFFKATKYPLAQAYYDTAMQVLPKDFPNYKSLQLKSAALNDLVSELTIIHQQDSLQGLARMNKSELEELIKEKIREYEEELAAQKQAEELASMGNKNGATLPGMNLPGALQKNTWYFYNDQTVAQGKRQFEKKWGRRKLEHLWRISNKRSLTEGGDNLTAANDSTQRRVKGENDPLNPNFYLKNIPYEKEQMLISDSLIEDAYYALGIIYKDKMEDTLKSIEAFEKLLSRYQETDHRLPVYYSLYKMFSKQNNLDKAEYYKTLILKEFPDSDYAKIISDPNYYKELYRKMNSLQEMYAETYEHYNEGHYYTVNSKATKALAEYKEPKDILSRFGFLQLIAQAKLQQDSLAKDSLIVHLQRFIQTYKGEAIVPRAEKMLSYLSKGKKTKAADTLPKTKKYDLSIYHYKPKARHMYGVVVREEKGKVNINALKTRFTDFNNKNHAIDNLSVSNIMLGKKVHFLIIGSFPNEKKAMLYYREMLKDDYVLSLLKKGTFDTFVIGQKNYPVFYKDKDLDKYLAFFKKYYLKEK
jgi:tetratricopeptide (TPR) repeat protein